MARIPRPSDEIYKIWDYAKTLDVPANGGFADWMEWMGWNGVMYKNFRDEGSLPETLDELHICLVACRERNIVSGDFKDGDERQAFPRVIMKKIVNLNN